jgi:hypothetical protein
MEIVPYNGWERNVRLANAALELVVTQDVGPRVIRFALQGERNVFAEIEGQQGGRGEDAWMIRGGHRLWIAPEAKPVTYELDNVPVETEETDAGVTFRQEPGPITHVAKRMTVALASDADEAVLTHVLENMGEDAIELAPWALTVMAPGGQAVIPLPDKIPHTERLTPNQAWILWPYTDFSDRRWTLGGRYVFFRQDAERGPNKLGIAHREGWAAYVLDGFVFLKMFDRLPGQVYADGGANFQTFSNERMLEMESLGPLVTLAPGESVTHVERWRLFRDVPPIESETDADTHLLPLVRQSGVIPSPEA